MKKNRNNPNQFVNLNNFNEVESKSDTTISSSKTNPLNDGVKNADDQQKSLTRLNMPRGARKPESTFK